MTGPRLGVRIHRAIALIALLPMALAALTGGCLIFRDALDRWLEPELYRSAGPAQPIDAVLAAAIAAVPERTPGLIVLPSADRPTAAVMLAGEPKRQLVMDPADGRVLADRDPRTAPSSFVLEWHRRLFAGPIGEWIVGISGCVALIALGTGLWAWWPKRWSWRHGSTARIARGSPAFSYDLHRVVGVCALPILAGIVITGLAMTFPKGTRAAMRASEPPKPPSSEAGAGADAPIEPMIAAARGILRGAIPQVIVLPKTPDDAVGVRMRFADELSHGARSVVWFDRRSAAILRVDDFRNLPPANRAIAAAFPIHTGEVIGAAGAVIWPLTALALLVLAATGAWLWWRRTVRALPPEEIA